MKLSDLAKLMRKPISEVEEMLKEQDTVTVDLQERKSKNSPDNFDMEVM